MAKRRKHCAPEDSFTVSMRSIRTVTTFQSPNVKAFVSEAGLDEEVVEKINKKIIEATAWIQTDNQRIASFQNAPLTTLLERFPDLLDFIPEGVIDGIDGDINNTACSDLPLPTDYADCIGEILRRVMDDHLAGRFVELA